MYMCICIWYPRMCLHFSGVSCSCPELSTWIRHCVIQAACLHIYSGQSYLSFVLSHTVPKPRDCVYPRSPETAMLSDTVENHEMMLSEQCQNL